MTLCPCCDGSSADALAAYFDRSVAEHDLVRYRRQGPDRTTRMLLDLVAPYGVQGAHVLDIGGGIGVVGQELLGAGAASAVLVDASPAYLAVARREAEAAGLGDRIEIVEGDFVRVAADIAPADIVTLDRVICCYPDADALVGASAERARRLYAIVLPRDRWLLRAAVALLNLGYRLRGRAFRIFAHPNTRIDALVAAAGLVPWAERRTTLWRVVVYDRGVAAAP
jgi:magnesium-protoporphyrin O-methyltransferase